MRTVDFFNFHIVVNIIIQVLYDYVARMAKHLTGCNNTVMTVLMSIDE